MIQRGSKDSYCVLWLMSWQQMTIRDNLYSPASLLPNAQCVKENSGVF